VVISGYQWLSVIISGYQWLSVVISGYQWLSVVISGYQWLSVVISGYISGSQTGVRGPFGVLETIFWRPRSTFQEYQHDAPEEKKFV